MDQRLDGWKYYTKSGAAGALVVDPSGGESLKNSFSIEACQAVEVRHGRLPHSNELTRLLGNGTDAVYLFTTSRAPASRIERLASANDIGCVASYLVVPSFQNPRWFFPLDRDTILGSGNIVKPSRFRARLAWRLTRLLTRFGQPHLLFPSRIFMFEKGPGQPTSDGILKDHLEAELGARDLEFILYTGARGYYQKFTAQVMDRRGHVVAYAKIGHTPQAKQRILDEAATLSRLERMGLEHTLTPRLLSCKTLPGLADVVMIQTPPPATFRTWNKRLTDRHVTALAELFLMGTPERTDGEALLAATHSKLAALGSTPTGAVLEEARRLLAESLRVLPAPLKGLQLTLGLSHGDFSPWNILLDTERQRLFIFDWEISKPRVPLWDLYNFVIHSEVLIYSAEPAAMLNTLLSRRGATASMIDRYCQVLDREVHCDRRWLLAIYLVEVIAFYLDYSSKQAKAGHAIEREVDRLLRASTAMLKVVLSRV